MKGLDPNLDLGSLVAGLLEDWKDSVKHGGPTLGDWRNRGEAQVVTIMTLTANIHARAMLVQDVLPDGLTIAHMPLVRAIFEETMTVAWCDEVADGAAAIVNESARQRRALRANVEKTRSMEGMADAIAGADWTDLSTRSSTQARHMEQLCSEVGLDGAYVYYRLLSELSHVSIATIDSYLDQGSFTPGQALSVKSNAGALTSSRSWAHLIAACLVWSGRVVDYLDHTRARRNDLRRAARALGVEEALPVAYHAYRRGQRVASRRGNNA